MKCRRLLVVPLLLFMSCAFVFAQNETPPPAGRPLRNNDVLRMHRAGMKPGKIIAKIVTSPCTFDTFPPVLRELKMKGVPETVIMAMAMVPYGPPASPISARVLATESAQTARVQIPAGTLIEIETAVPISSARVGEGDRINFLVSRRVLVNGVLVINRGALARARVIKSKRARAWGRAGALKWTLEDVVAVDGTVVPIKLSDHVKGNSHSAAVVAAAIVTGAIVFPYTPPVGLIWALKKGGEAVLDESRKATAVVGQSTEVAGVLPKKKKVTYHSVDKLKAANSPKSQEMPAFNKSFRATPIRRN